MTQVSVAERESPTQPSLLAEIRDRSSSPPGMVLIHIPKAGPCAGVARAQLARKNDAATGSFCTRLFSPVSSFSISPLFISPLFISPLFLYLSCFYISLVYISPSFLYLPCFYISPEPWASHSFILSVHIHAQQATPPHQARSFS